MVIGGPSLDFYKEILYKVLVFFLLHSDVSGLKVFVLKFCVGGVGVPSSFLKGTPKEGGSPRLLWRGPQGRGG